jgi:hypothetical protein
LSLAELGDSRCGAGFSGDVAQVLLPGTLAWSGATYADASVETARPAITS